MKTPIRVLFIEDSDDDKELLLLELRKGGFDPTYLRVDTEETLISALSGYKWDIILSDYVMPNFDGLSALKLAQQSDIDIPFILISGTIGEDVAVMAMKAGAHDYLLKDNLMRFIPAIERELREAEIRRQRKSSAEALRQSEERMRMIVEGTPYFFFYTQDATGNLTYVSPSVTKISGYSIEEWMNRRDWFITDSEINIKAKEATRAHLSGELIDGAIFVELRHANGNLIILEIFEQPVLKDGIVTGLHGIAHDITEKRKMLNDIIAAKEQAEKSDKLKSEFLAQMSHEIRTPMNTVINYASLIKDEYSQNISAELSGMLDNIASAGYRMVRTLNLILNVSELQVGSYKPKMKLFDITKDLLKDIKSEYLDLTVRKGLKFNVKNQLNESEIFADEYSVRQIIKNLLDNAIQYTDHGEINLILNNDEKGNTIISVEDTGIGISKEFINQIFEPFMQEERGYSRSFEGNGLGLTLVKGYCEINNALINVESVKDKGSKFTITFPPPKTV